MSACACIQCHAPFGHTVDCPVWDINGGSLSSANVPAVRFGQHVMDPANDPERRFNKEKSEVPLPKPVMQQFGTGATRSDDSYKPDFEGFFSPLVLSDYAEFMQRARLQDDGRFRSSDNWQRGIPFHKYLKSLFRHFMQLWKLHRGYPVEPEMRASKLEAVTVRSAIHGIMFNSMGYLHEYLLSEAAWTNRIISEQEDGTSVTPATARTVA